MIRLVHGSWGLDKRGLGIRREAKVNGVGGRREVYRLLPITNTTITEI